MTDDRDTRRTSDPLHDTVDESDAVVIGEINPDHTPVQDVVARITAIVGELDSDTRERLAEEIGGREKRGKFRAANQTLKAVAESSGGVVHFDPDQFKHDLREGMEEWEPFKELRRKVDACDEDRQVRAVWRKRAAWVGSLLAGSVMTVLIWAVRSLDARADAGAEERLRVQMIYRHETAIRVLELKQAELIGTIRARLRPVPVPDPDNDRGEP